MQTFTIGLFNEIYYAMGTYYILGTLLVVNAFEYKF